MSDAFRDLLRKVGSGSHTSKALTRQESAAATRMMLRQEATPAQIGAFMIAHRIRRPTGEELAGILDAYDQLGPHLQPIAAAYPPIVLGIPYDGRSRTAPISPLTTLLLITAGCPVVLHGGDRMPTKYGLPLIELWQGLGVDWTQLSFPQTQQVFAETLLGFVYLPNHFPLAHHLVPYRDQIGKRPPFATAELFWCPYGGEAVIVAGFVHPPTEERARSALALRAVSRLITIKGLEGSCDLPRDRTCIIGLHSPTLSEESDRLLLHPRDYGFETEDVALAEPAELIHNLTAVVQGTTGKLFDSAVWNGGFYLWQAGPCPTLETGLEQARTLLLSGQVALTLDRIATAVQAAARTTRHGYPDGTPDLATVTPTTLD